MNRSVLSLCFLMLSAVSIAPAQTYFDLPELPTYTPWEASVSGAFLRADIGHVSDLFTDFNKNLAPGAVPVSTNSQFNMSGGDLTVQQNYKSWFAGQADLFGGIRSRRVTVPAADLALFNGSSAIELKPQILSAGYGPVFTDRKNPKYQPWGRCLFGIAHTDLNLDAAMKQAFSVYGPSLSSRNSFAVQVGGGVDFVVSRHIAVRASVDNMRTWLWGEGENQIRASVGIAWRFGGGSFDY